MKHLIPLFLIMVSACGGGSSTIDEPDPPTIPTQYQLGETFTYEYNGYSGVGVRVDDIIYFTPSAIANSDRVVTAQIDILTLDDDGDLSIRFTAYSFHSWLSQEHTATDLMRSGSNWSNSDGSFKMSVSSAPTKLENNASWSMPSWSGEFGEVVLTLDSDLNGSDSRGCDVSGSRSDYVLNLEFANCVDSGSYTGVIFEISGKVRGVAIKDNIASGLYYDIVSK